MSRKVKKQTPKIKLMFQLLFEKYLLDLEAGDNESDIYQEFLDGMSPEYQDNTPPAGIVRDFIAGMTDKYFMRQCQLRLLPQRLPSRF